MLNRILITLLLCLGMHSLAAQDLVDCSIMLEDAKEAYTAGMVELVPELLMECIQSKGLAGEARIEAYKLVINSYLFDYMTEDADSLMDDFVSEFPNYRAQDSDPQEFVLLLDAHLIAAGIDPNEVPADTTGRKNFFQRFREREITKGAGEFGNTLGFNVGIPLSIPISSEGFSLGNPAQDESSFGLLPGIMAGAEVNLILKRKLESSFGLIYDVSRFTYSSTPISQNSYRYVESQHQLLVPLSLLYKLNPENLKVCYYLRGGFVPSYLFKASGKGTRTVGGGADDLTVDRTDISQSRRNMNLDVLVGGGFRIPLKNAFIFTEIRLTTSLIKSNQEDMRYANNDLTWLLYHVDNNFRVHKLTICGGLCWDLTKE
jgi:hypothetical protein